MLKLFVLSLLIVTLSSCRLDKVDEVGLKWTVVDSQLLEREAVKIITNANPYPEGFDTPLNEIRSERSRLAKLTSEIRVSEKKKCLLSKDNKSFDEVRDNGAVLRQWDRARYNNECVKKIESDELLKDLNQKLISIQKIEEYQREHNRNVSEKSRILAEKAIEYYSKNKFDLVIDKRAKIKFNPTGLSLDTTDAVLSVLTSSEWQSSVDKKI